jgi:DNA ligase-1
MDFLKETNQTEERYLDLDIDSDVLALEQAPTLNDVINNASKPIENVVAVKNIFEELKNTPGRLDKEAIVNKHKDNYLFMEVLKFLCDDMITTGISTKKITKLLDFKEENMTLDLDIALKYIQKHNTGKDENIAWVQTFIRCQERECYDFLVGVFTKSYKCGITAKTLNKIVPNSVSEFGVMLAESYFKYKKDKNSNKIKVVSVDLEKIKSDFVITEKLDGMRCVMVKQDKYISFYSRQGQKITGLNEIEKDALVLPNGVYDGELIAEGIFLESKDQYKETMKRARIKGNKTKLRLVCFDYIESINDFLSGVCNTPFIERKNKLYSILRTTPDINEEDENISLDTCEKIKYLDNLYVGKDIKEISATFETVMSFGGEGLMINIADAPYQTKRVKTLLKYKEFYNADLRVTGVYEGTGANIGKLGGIYVNYKGFTDKVGSGFTLNERETYFKNPELIVGKIVDIQYFEETTNQENDDISMRFATFKGIRDDKNEESYEI